MSTNTLLGQALDDLRQAADLANTLMSPSYHSLEPDEQDILVPRLVSLIDMARESLCANQQSAEGAGALPDGYAAAGAWWRAFCARRDAAAPYAFPSELKEFALSLAPEHMLQFLDAIGEMMVTRETAGVPSADYLFSSGRVQFCCLSPQEQDAQWDEDGKPVTELARRMVGMPASTNPEASHD